MHSFSSDVVSIPESRDASFDEEEGPQVYKYALKKLRPDLKGIKKLSGIIDLMVEAQFLSTLSHPNIITLRGYGGDFGTMGFFIVMDRVDRTLGRAIELWRTQKEIQKREGIEQYGNRQFSSLRRRGRNVQLQRDGLDHRIAIAYQLASALDYLHNHSILYRDLKPHNIGLDKNDNVKIFDFGLAKELKPVLKFGTDQYLGRTKVGTLRYMAPEVLNGDVYGLPADMYSFSIVFWELLSLKTPFAGLEVAGGSARSAHGKKRNRPTIKRTWPKKIKQVLKFGWHHEPSRRPLMHQVCAVFSQHLADKF